MMFLILDKTPAGSVQYLLEHTNKKYLKKQVLELLQLICSAGYSKVYKKVPQGKMIQEWIKASEENQLYVFHYLANAFDQLYFSPVNEIPNKQKQIITDYIQKINYNNLLDQYNTNIKTAVFRYNEQYGGSFIPTNTELPITKAVEEYRVYLDWKTQQNPSYFKKDV